MAHITMPSIFSHLSTSLATAIHKEESFDARSEIIEFNFLVSLVL